MSAAANAVSGGGDAVPAAGNGVCAACAGANMPDDRHGISSYNGGDCG